MTDEAGQATLREALEAAQDAESDDALTTDLLVDPVGQKGLDLLAAPPQRRRDALGRPDQQFW